MNRSTSARKRYKRIISFDDTDEEDLLNNNLEAGEQCRRPKRTCKTNKNLNLDRLLDQQLDNNNLNQDVCFTCQEGGKLLQCDKCFNWYHLYCASYCKDIPNEEFYCFKCNLEITTLD